MLALMALVLQETGTLRAPAAGLHDAGHRRRRPLLWRLPADAGNFRAERGRGPQRRHPAFAEPMVIPISIGLIVGLFALQHFGTAGVGSWFGPIMLIWFVALFALGLQHVVHHPHVLAALSPLHAVDFAIRHKIVAFVALGAVTLGLYRRRGALRRHGPFRPPRPSAGPGWCSCCRRCSSTTTVRARCCWTTRRRSTIRSSGWRRAGRSIRWWAWPRRRR